MWHVQAGCKFSELHRFTAIKHTHFQSDTVDSIVIDSTNKQKYIPNLLGICCWHCKKKYKTWHKVNCVQLHLCSSGSGTEFGHLKVTVDVKLPNVKIEGRCTAFHQWWWRSLLLSFCLQFCWTVCVILCVTLGRPHDPNRALRSSTANEQKSQDLDS